MSAIKRKLVVIDGANSIFRAFFAIPGLRSPDGRPTNAAYGFVNMLIKVVREEQPDFVAVAYDARGGTFRHRAYKDYKAGRDATPEDLSAQIPMVKELVAAHGVPWIEVPDFEADDVIATLVEHAPDDVETVIVSSDKDLMQLVSDRVTLSDGMKDRRYGPADVEARFGVPPERMLDLRALVGDPSDNIPGVKGIGEKGAAKLITQWRTLESLLEHAVDVKAKRAREALLEQADNARLSKELATLRSDAPLPIGWGELATPVSDVERLRELYREYGFTRLLDALSQANSAGETPSESFELDLEWITTPADLRRSLERANDGEPLALLLLSGEGSAIDARPVGLALSDGEERAGYVPFVGEGLASSEGIPAREAFETLEAFFVDHGKRSWIGVDCKQTQSIFAQQGVQLPLPAQDLGLAAFLLDPAGSHHVSALAEQQLGRTLPTWEEMAGRGAKAVPAELLDPKTLADWAGRQAAAVFALAPLLRDRLESDGLLALHDDVETPLTAVLSRVERNGVRIDETKLAELSVEYEKELDRIEREIYGLAGEEFKVNSPKQLQQILFEKLKLPVLKKTKTGYSTDEGVLEQLASQHELPSRVLAWRRLSKLKSTYVDAIPPLVNERTGRIHPVFHQMGAATGRMSASNPNVQNIPIRTEEGIRIREAFVPAEGKVLLSADYSQVELRILAHYSGDESLIQAFKDEDDVHRRTAAAVANVTPDEVTDDQRARAKAVNFGIIYGSSAFGLANTLGIATAEAQETIDAYFARYTGVRRFLDRTVAEAVETGWVSTWLGRRRYLPDLRSRNRVLRQAAERMAVNTVIQGTAADLIKKAMVDVERALAETATPALMILQVHDELVFEVPDDAVGALEALVRSQMEGVFELEVPLVVDVGIGANWREAH